MMRFLTLLTVVCVGVALGCAGLGRPSITPQTPHVSGVSRSGVELEMLLSVENPNPFSLMAKDVTGTLSLGAKDKEVGSASAQLSEPIAANSTEQVSSQLEIAWTSTSALREFVTQSEVPFRFQGEVTFAGGPVNVQVPFTLRGHLTRTQLAQAAAAGLSDLLSR